MRRTARSLSFAVVACTVAALSKVHAKWIADPAYDFTASSRLLWAISYVALGCLAAYAMGLPERPRTTREAAVAATSAALLAALGISAVQLVVGDALLPRFVVFGSVLVVIPCQLVVNALARGGRTRDEGRDRVLLVGSDAERERLIDDLRMEPERAAALVATLTPAEAAAGASSRPVIDAVAAGGVTVVVLDRDAQAHDSVIAQAASLHESGVRVRTLQGFYEEWLGKLPLSELERASLFFDIGELHRARYVRVKRLIDLAGCALGLVALAAITPLVFVGNAFGNRGPLLYRQTRVGKGGEPFTILKFRTMRTDAGAHPAPDRWTEENDPRVTAFGRVLRQSHLDELPQVLNIARGELSIVGPRPEQPHYVEELSEKLAFYNLRHLVRPGLTGWAQVKYGYAGDERDALEKLQYEFFYLQHQDLSFDLRVVGRTVRSIAGGSGKGR